MRIAGYIWREDVIDKLAWKHPLCKKNRKSPVALPETFATFEEMAEFWDTHDITDYEQYLTPVEVDVVAKPRHEYVITLSDSLNTVLRRVQQAEGVSLNTLMNLWIQEKLQQYVTR